MLRTVVVMQVMLLIDSPYVSLVGGVLEVCAQRLKHLLGGTHVSGIEHLQRTKGRSVVVQY